MRGKKSEKRCSPLELVIGSAEPLLRSLQRFAIYAVGFGCSIQSNDKEKGGASLILEFVVRTFARKGDRLIDWIFESESLESYQEKKQESEIRNVHEVF